MAAGDGLISMTPTSIAHAGTSATINADGGVDFSAVTSLSLNGVFTGDYDNYLIVISSTCSASQQVIEARLRASGADASGGDYAYQSLFASSTTVSGARATSQTVCRVSVTDDDNNNGDHIHVYGPALAQPTAFRNVNVYGNNGATLLDYASTHSLSTAYDGITFIPASGSVTGTVHVFGYEE